LTALLAAVAASPASAALAVSLSATPTATRGGGTVVFTATVTNNGAAAITTLHVLIMMEGSERAGGEFLYSSSGEGSGLDCSSTEQGSTTANCFGSGLGPGQSAHISVTTQAQAEGSGGPVVVTATFEGSDGSRESAQTTVTVAGEEEEGPGGSRRGSSPPGGQGQPTGGEGQPTGGSKTVVCVVPKLRGRTLASAKKLLAKAHCRLGKVTKKRSKGKVGLVVSQKPKAGSRLKAGSAIAVVLRRH
jgi:hypothetical protein